MDMIEQLSQFGRLPRRHPLGQTWFGVLLALDAASLIDVGAELDIVFVVDLRSSRDALTERARRGVAEPFGHLLARSDDQNRSADGDRIAVPQDLQVARMAVYARTVGTVEIGDDQPPFVFLDLDMKTADPFVVDLNCVTLFATNRDRRTQLSVNAAPIGASDDA